MPTLRFRVPGRSQPIGGWLAALLPDVPRKERRVWIDGGRVTVEGQPCERGTAVCPPGAVVELSLDGDDLAAAIPAAIARERTEADRWEAIVATCPWSGGALGDAGTFEVVARDAGLARLSIQGPLVSGRAVLEALAERGLPVVGDLVRGGHALVAEEVGLPRGPLLASGGEGEPISLSALAAEIWRWDHDRREAPSSEHADTAPGRLVVSAETGRVLAGGHAWILQDEASDRADRFRPGALVEVEDRKGRSRGWARIEGTRAIAARIWAGPGNRRGGDSIEARVAKAIARRRPLLGLPSEQTSCFRLIHGEGDGLPGLFVDRLGPLIRVLVTGYAALPIRARVLGALEAQLPVTPEGEPFSVLEVLHLRSPARGQLDATRWVRGGLEDLRAQEALSPDGLALVARERGLAFELDPGWAEPRRPRPGYGLFVDQRENRERLAPFAKAEGGRWLNLFAHTGAFSVALLAAGAEQVTSVDLSGPYLARLDRNLALNAAAGVEPARHVRFRGDARRALEESGGELRGIVVDPPTAAAAGRRFWSVREDLEPMLRSCIDRLAEGGRLLVTQNRAGPPLGLDLVIERLARRAHREIASIEPAPPGADHPTVDGFPEGDPFEGVLLTLR